MKSDNPNVRGIKHMAFGVRDAAKALDAYARVALITSAIHFWMP